MSDYTEDEYDDYDNGLEDDGDDWDYRPFSNNLPFFDDVDFEDEDEGRVWMQTRIEHEKAHNQLTNMPQLSQHEYSIVPVDDSETDPEILRQLVERVSPDCKFGVYVVQSRCTPIESDPGDECDCELCR